MILDLNPECRRMCVCCFSLYWPKMHPLAGLMHSERTGYMHWPLFFFFFSAQHNSYYLMALLFEIFSQPKC